LTYEELLQETVRTLYLLNKVGRSVFVPHFIEKIPNALYWEEKLPSGHQRQQKCPDVERLRFGSGRRLKVLRANAGRRAVIGAPPSARPTPLFPMTLTMTAGTARDRMNFVDILDLFFVELQRRRPALDAAACGQGRTSGR